MNKHRKGCGRPPRRDPGDSVAGVGHGQSEGSRVSKNSAEPQGEGCRRRGAEAEVS